MLIYEIEEFDDCLYVGEDYQINLYLKSSFGSYDITDFTVAMQLREQILSAAPTVSVTKIVNATNGVDGVVSITIPATTTVNLVPTGKQKRKYHYDIRITDLSSQTSTIMRGCITARQSA